MAKNPSVDVPIHFQVSLLRLASSAAENPYTLPAVEVLTRLQTQTPETVAVRK
ncbi:MAG: hypothetical protein K2X35_19510 [Bryobacteraceae bacterium]|nr:hypothetical protein [Bryobacteraceae bacterium]